MSLFILEYYFVPSFFLNIGFHSYLLSYFIIYRYSIII